MPATRKGTCKVCRHAERVRIEDMRTAGVSFEVLSERFSIGKSILHRHWQQHVSADRKLMFLVGKGTVEQLRERAAEENMSVLDSLAIVKATLMGQLVSQAEMGAAFQVAMVSARLLDVLREIGRMTGEIHERTGPSVNVNVAVLNQPTFADLQDGLLRIARAHPEARADIIDLLRRLDGAVAPPSTPRLINGVAHA